MKMLANNLLIILLTSVFCSFGCLANRDNSAIELQQFTANKSVDKTFETFWQASLQGDMKILEEVTALEPESSLNSCRNEKKEISAEKRNQDPMPITAPKEDSYKTLYSDDKVSEPLLITSDYIRWTKSLFGDLKINYKSVYKDEALFDVTIPEQGNYKETGLNRKFFFFHKIDGEWKLTGVGSRNLIMSIWDGKIDFAVPRQCK